MQFRVYLKEIYLLVIFFNTINGNNYVKYKGSNVKWRSSIINIEFIEVSDVICKVLHKKK